MPENLKGQCHDIFYPPFFIHDSNPSGLVIHMLDSAVSMTLRRGIRGAQANISAISRPDGLKS